MPLSRAALESIKEETQESGYSLVAVLMGLGFLGFFISVAFSGLGAARLATELLHVDAEFHDLRSSLYSLDLCKNSCSESQKLLKPRIGKWLLKPSCDESGMRVAAKLAKPKKENEAARRKYRQWKQLGISPGGLVCQFRSSNQQRANSSKRTKLCPQAGSYLVAVDFEHETVECR